MRQFLLCAVLLVPAVALVAGCNGATSSTATPNSAVAGEFKEANYEALDEFVKANKGKVILMDFWATWCVPCVKKFPHFVDTHKKYSAKGLLCASVSLDPRGKEEKYDKDSVGNFLKEKDAAFPNFVLREYAADDEKINKRFGLDGGIPFMVLFDKTGKRVWDSEQKELNNAELDKLIEEELAK